MCDELFSVEDFDKVLHQQFIEDAIKYASHAPYKCEWISPPPGELLQTDMFFQTLTNVGENNNSNNNAAFLHSESESTAPQVILLDWGTLPIPPRKALPRPIDFTSLSRKYRPEDKVRDSGPPKKRRAKARGKLYSKSLPYWLSYEHVNGPICLICSRIGCNHMCIH
jgi:hypothetical protein